MVRTFVQCNRSSDRSFMMDPLANFCTSQDSTTAVSIKGSGILSYYINGPLAQVLRHIRFKKCVGCIVQ